MAVPITSVTVSMNIVSMVVILTPSVPPIIRAMFTVPNVALQNVMACRVYRLLKLGLVSDEPKSYSSGSGGVQLRYVVKNNANFDKSSSRRNLSAGTKDSASSTFTVHDVAQDDKALSLQIHIGQETNISTDNKGCLGADDVV